MKVRQRDRAQLLGQVPLFSYCSQRELAKVAKLANELELPAGHTLIHEDAEVAYSFLVLVDGEAEVRRRNRRVATLGPGDCFGELALILRRPRTATVTLTAPSRLLSISAHNFRPLLMTSPEIQFKLLEALAEPSHRRRHSGGTASTPVVPPHSLERTQCFSRARESPNPRRACTSV